MKNRRIDSILEQQPILWTLLSAPLSFALIVLTGAIPGAVVSVISPEMAEIAAHTGGILCAFLLLALFQRRFRPDFQGCLGWAADVRTAGPLFLGSCLFLALFVLLPNLLRYGVGSLRPSLHALPGALYAGTAEEIAFRAIPVSIGMGFGKQREDRIVLIALLTSLVFGFNHGGNLFQGSSPSYVVCQIAAASALGVFLCAMLLRTGSVLPCMLLHAVNDLICLSVQPRGVLGAQFHTVFLFSLGGALLLAAFGLYLLRSSKRPGIAALWEKKWNVR